MRGCCHGKPARKTRSPSDATIGLPWVAKGEFLRGALLVGHDAAADAFLLSFPTIWPNERTLHVYAAVYRDLRRGNALIGPNDLWIAALALEWNLPLLTRNAVEYSRVPKLRVERYG